MKEIVIISLSDQSVKSIDVLGNGYVRLIDLTGSDATFEFKAPIMVARQLAGSFLTEELEQYFNKGENLYNSAMKNGVAPEHARLFLPSYEMHVVYRWSCSLRSIALFLNQRLKEDSQKEIQDYAKAVRELITPSFPVCMMLMCEQ